MSEKKAAEIIIDYMDMNKPVKNKEFSRALGVAVEKGSCMSYTEAYKWAVSKC